MRRGWGLTVAVVAGVLLSPAAVPRVGAQDVALEEPVVTTIEAVQEEPAYAVALCPLSCQHPDAPPESSGGVSCTWYSRTTFHGTRNRETGAVSGTWSGMYTTTDCVNGSYSPVHMDYMFIRATNSLGSSTFQTSRARSCTRSSSQCSGLTSEALDAGCSPCNGWWYLTTTSSWRLPERLGSWSGSSQKCGRSGDGRQLDCQSSSGVFIG